MICYFDTSAIIKLVVEEAGSGNAEDAWNSATEHFSCVSLYPEGRAALAVAVKARRLTPRDMLRARSAFERKVAACDRIGIDGTLARHAGDLAETRALRWYDAVHLASALTIPDVTLITWDRDLARAARAEGLTVAGVAPA